MPPLDPTPEELLARDGWLRQLAAALARDGQAGDDLAQETWLHALRAPGRRLRDPRAWMATLLGNAARNFRRGEARRAGRERGAARPERDPRPGPFDLAAYEERRRELVGAVEALPPAQREVLVARYWEVLEPAEIARRNGESAEAVRQRLRRALTALRARVERESDDGRCAWLLPLLGTPRLGELSAPVSALGGLGMKKGLALGVVLVLVGFVGIGGSLWRAGVPDARQTAQPVPESSVTATSLAELELEGRRSARVELFAESRSGADVRLRLVDATGAARDGVPFWADERPFTGHPGRSPEDAARTGTDGRIALELLGEGAFLWFELCDGLSVAVERGDLEGLGTLVLPPLRSVPVELRGLTPELAWRISAWPAWEDPDDGDLEHGGADARALPPVGGQSAVWIVRHRVQHEGKGDPACARFELVEGLPTAFYCQSLDVLVEPEIQVLTDPPLVVAYAGTRYEVVSFEVLESSGEPSEIGGMAALSSSADRIDYRLQFEAGAGRIPRSHAKPLEGAFLSVVLRDGELFRVSLAGPSYVRGEPIRLVRGEGRPAALRLEIDEAVQAGEAPRWVFVRSEGRERYAGRFESFSPLPDDDEDSLAAWVHEGTLVVQAEGPDVALGALRLATPDGCIAERSGERLVLLPAIELEPIEPSALIEKLATPVGADSLDLMYEVAWPDPDAPGNDRWLIAAYFSFLLVDGFEWRHASQGSHRALPSTLILPRPRDERSRLSVEVGNGGSYGGWTGLPLPAPR